MRPDSRPVHTRHPKGPFTRSLLAAWDGIRHVLLRERNARIELVVAALVVVAGLVLRVSRVEWAILLLLIFLVLALELLNTGLEAVVDLATPEFHYLARVAKDAAAGAVLLMAIGSVCVGVLIFLPRIWTLLLLFL